MSRVDLSKLPKTATIYVRTEEAAALARRRYPRALVYVLPAECFEEYLVRGASGRRQAQSTWEPASVSADGFRAAKAREEGETGAEALLAGLSRSERALLSTLLGPGIDTGVDPGPIADPKHEPSEPSEPTPPIHPSKHEEEQCQE